MNLKMISLKTGTSLILVLVIIICGCTSLPINTGNSKNQSNTPQSISFKDLNINLIPQRGDNSCWAASLIMAYNFDSSKNNENVTPKIFEDIKKDIDSKNIQVKDDSILSYQNLSWLKIKQNFDKGNPLVFYKYFNNSEAHVFVGKGYQETESEKWILVNDPWPKNIGNKSAISFENIIKPIFTNVIDSFPKISVGINPAKLENSFSIISSDHITDTLNVKVKRTESSSILTNVLAQSSIQSNADYKLGKEKIEVRNLAKSWIKNIKQYDEGFLKLFGIERSLKDSSKLNIILKSFTEITNVFEYSYQSPLVQKSIGQRTANATTNSEKGSLFEPNKVYYITVTEDGIKKVVLSMEPDVRNNKKIYISKIEPYKNSKQEKLDLLGNVTNFRVHKAQIMDTNRGYLFYFKLGGKTKELVYDQFDHLNNVSKLTSVFNNSLSNIKIHNASEAILKSQFKKVTQEN